MGRIMEPLSKITKLALDEITRHQFSSLPKLAITGLLDDFQYAWLQRLNVPYNFEMLDIARRLCSEHNSRVFKATRCQSIEQIRNMFSAYIEKHCAQDQRVILSAEFDGTQINVQWIDRAEYMQLKQPVVH